MADSGGLQSVPKVDTKAPWTAAEIEERYWTRRILKESELTPREPLNLPRQYHHPMVRRLIGATNPIFGPWRRFNTRLGHYPAQLMSAVFILWGVHYWLKYHVLPKRGLMVSKQRKFPGDVDHNSKEFQHYYNPYSLLDQDKS